MVAPRLIAATDIANLVASGQVEFGAGWTRPLVIVVAGQSNAQGSDHNGDHTVQSNIFITNSVTNPTALVPAAYGTAPLNQGYGGSVNTSAVVTDPNLAYINQGVASANEMRLRGDIHPSRPVVIVAGWRSSTPISAWVDATPVDMWAVIQQGLGVVTAAYPSAKIDYVIWHQGENDNTGTYGTDPLYLGAFDRLITQFQALPTWTQQTRMGVVELGTWASNTQQARNRALRSVRGYRRYPWVDFITGSGSTESTDNPIPHYDGASLNELGRRHRRKFMEGKPNGLAAPAVAATGSDLTFGNQIVLAASGTYNLSIDDIRSGALIIANGAALVLPNPALAEPTPIWISVVGNTTLSSVGNITFENVGTVGSGTTRTISGGRLYSVVPFNQTSWFITQEYPRSGNQTRGTSSTASTSGAAVTLTYAQCNGTTYTLNGNAVTLQMSFGNDVVLFNQTGTSTLTLPSGNFILPDGSNGGLSLTLQPGEVVWLTGGISGTNSIGIFVTYLTMPRLRRGTTAQRPSTLGSTDRVEYFDDTLGKPIWWKGTGWVDATGATV